MTFGQLNKIIMEHIDVAVKDQILLKPESGFNKLINVEAIDDQVFMQSTGYRSQSQH